MMSVTSDQQRFLLSHLIALSLALPYRYVPQKLRNHYNYFPAISYLICKYTSGKYVQRATMCSSLAFLSYAHLSRQIIDYGSYKIDISGPYMIAVQKITSLGYCMYDGFRIKTGVRIETVKESSELSSEDSNTSFDNDNNNNFNDDGLRNRLEKESVQASRNNHGLKDGWKNDKVVITDEQKQLAVMDLPTLSEFMGYFFHFPSIICGPIMYFNDYKDFVDYSYEKDLPPGRFKAVFKKLAISSVCILLILQLMPKFEIEFLRSHEFLVETSLFMRFYYLMIFTILSRLKYYVAWHLGEAVSNASGLGFNGYDANNNPRWDLISNMDIFTFETSFNLRQAIHAWNKSTQTWLRRTAYERAPKSLGVVSTYCLSAIWHGFYPGYYMTFLGGALFTYAARSGRRFIRPYFQKGTVLPRFYDAITFILTRLTITYIAFPFVILDLKNNLAIYKSLYFSLHLLAFGAISLRIIRRK